MPYVYLEKASFENFIKLNTFSVLFEVKGHNNTPSWKA